MFFKISFLFTVKSDMVSKVLPVLRKYQAAKNSGFFLSIPFTTLADYLWLLRAASEALSVCEKNALFYLAAAVSDFYVPREAMVNNFKFYTKQLITLIIFCVLFTASS